MNCESIRNRLFAQPDPSVVTAPFASHLDACPACHAWHRLLIQVETGIGATAPAVNSGRAKRKLIAQFRGAAPVALKPAAAAAAKSRVIAKPVPTVQPASSRPSVGERLARLWPAGLVAAALLAGVLVWTSLRGGKADGPMVASLPPDQFLEKVVAAKVKLDAAPDAVARLAVLDALERDIHEEATTISKVTPQSEMDSLARMYERVVGEAMVEQARLMSGDERKARLPEYTERLSRAQQDANRAAAEAPPGSVEALRLIATAAQKGRTELARMMQG